MATARWSARLTVLVATLLAAGCASSMRVQPMPGVQPTFFDRQITFHGRRLDLHLAQPDAPPRRDVLVLYASGDGGWFGAAVDMFQQIAAFGYPAVGFSSKAYLALERAADPPVTIPELGREYQMIIAAAREALGLPASAPTILTGWSRGAAFAVMVAADKTMPAAVAGVVALGLSEHEEIVVRGRSRLGLTRRVIGELGVESYRLIPEIAPIPCAVIQSAGDEYLHAAKARELFGPDTGDRRFYAIDASNHRFSGGGAALREALRSALEWIEERAEAHRGESGGGSPRRARR